MFKNLHYFDNTGCPDADPLETRQMAAVERQALEFLSSYTAAKQQQKPQQPHQQINGGEDTDNKQPNGQPNNNGTENATATPSSSGATLQQLAHGTRLARLFVRLYALRAIDADTIESLFFAHLIGQVQIDKVVPYILRLGGSGVSA